MTPEKEDYLKALLSLSETYIAVPNKRLIEMLSVSPPSVSEMLSKLEKEGFISYMAYKGSTLTDKGKKEAKKLTRCHRIWEVFLTECLGYTWSDAHEEAHHLEHCTSIKMMQRLDEYLNYPKFCPHGSVIPRDTDKTSLISVRLLSGMHEGEEAIIRKVTEEKELMDYLQEQGIRIGMKILIKKREAYEGSYFLSTDLGEIIISHKAAGQIYVDG